MSFDKIFVLGAGAIGSAYGALLSKGNEVTLIGDKAHIDAVKSNGLTVHGSVNESFHLKTDTEIRTVPEKTLIVLTTKAYDSAEAIGKIGKLFQKDTVILILQNGLGNEEIIKRAAGDRVKILRGITNMAAEFFKPGEIRFWNGETIIEQDSIAEKIADVFNQCKLKTTLSKDIHKEVWSKLVVNCVVNPLTAIFRTRNREIAADSLKPVRHQIAKECILVGKAEGIALPQNLEEKIDKELFNYENFSSMCQDIMKNKRTEIDFLNGKIVELGQKHNISTPMNETLVYFIKFLEEKNGLSKEYQTKER
ncbi:MAG: ketopantoate reductase family protein [Candidatus Bathyarchaeota archaeon]|nr:ketopantoate reductase family protein [Candidatus Bathyarchaeota archaeon]MDH5786787.1 ketopantoate reductase family protein [Candidatus Bathyarchaeota archaeon]